MPQRRRFQLKTEFMLMASPIESTPPVDGEDAERLLEQLANVASPEEIARRKEEARRFLAEVSRPKYPRLIVAPSTAS